MLVWEFPGRRAIKDLALSLLAWELPPAADVANRPPPPKHESGWGKGVGRDRFMLLTNKEQFWFSEEYRIEDRDCAWSGCQEWSGWPRLLFEDMRELRPEF